jgi:hypothetical protein
MGNVSLSGRSFCLLERVFFRRSWNSIISSLRIFFFFFLKDYHWTTAVDLNISSFHVFLGLFSFTS